MAAAVQAATSLPVELVEGSGGVFKVSIDGKVVFSKPSGGKFPTGEEIVGMVRDRADGQAHAGSTR